MNDIIEFLNNEGRLAEVAIEQAEGTVLMEQGFPVLATPCPATFGYAVGGCHLYGG
ncbi:hypothetical protein AB0D83_38815 [Streptomyces decoyicus]|uniref:hypothetical protein n=1 Tax=Streptomyces decoyicus TaxID=249567 RepID=UPI0033E4A94D